MEKKSFKYRNQKLFFVIETFKNNLTEEFFFNHKCNWHQFNATIEKNLTTDTKIFVFK